MAKSFIGTIQFPAAIRPTGGQPLDDRVVVNSYEDLLAKDTFGTAVYDGMIVAIKGTNKVYALVNAKQYITEPNDSFWERVGGDGFGTINAENFSAAKKLATADNKGQIIYVLNSEKDAENTGITYGSGLYYVVGDNTLLKLAQSSTSGDINDTVNDLVKRVAVLEEKQTNDDDVIHMITGDDVDNA